jgi:hypothetical protein
MLVYGLNKKLQSSQTSREHGLNQQYSVFGIDEGRLTVKITVAPAQATAEAG